MSGCAIVNHGGHWKKNNYEDGDQELIRIPPHGISFRWLSTQIEAIVRFDKNTHKYLLYGLVDSPDGGKIKLSIIDDGDLTYLMEQSNTLRVFVTISEKMTPPPIVQNSFANLLNAQNTQCLPYFYPPMYPYIYPSLAEPTPTVRPKIPTMGQHDSFIFPTSTQNENEIFMDIHNNDSGGGGGDDDDEDDGCGGDGSEDDDSDSENDCSKVNPHLVSHVGESFHHDDVEDDAWQEERIVKGQPWVIRGALYHASIPCEQFENFEEFEEFETPCDTLYVGATFISKGTMKTTLESYHLDSRREYKVDRSDTKRFVAVCKNNDECQFLMIATARGSMWRINKWIAPHSCHTDFTGQLSTSRQRRARHCSICHVVGHTKTTCPERVT